MHAQGGNSRKRRAGRLRLTSRRAGGLLGGLPEAAGGGQQVCSGRRAFQAETSGGGSPGRQRACLVLVGGSWASKGPCQAPGEGQEQGPTLPTWAQQDPARRLLWGRRRPQVFCWPRTPGRALPRAALPSGDHGSWSYCRWQPSGVPGQWAPWDSGSRAGGQGDLCQNRGSVPPPSVTLCLPLSLSRGKPPRADGGAGVMSLRSVVPRPQDGNGSAPCHRGSPRSQ